MRVPYLIAVASLLLIGISVYRGGRHALYHAFHRLTLSPEMLAKGAGCLDGQGHIPDMLEKVQYNIDNETFFRPEETILLGKVDKHIAVILKYKARDYTGTEHDFETGAVLDVKNCVVSLVNTNTVDGDRTK